MTTQIEITKDYKKVLNLCLSAHSSFDAKKLIQLNSAILKWCSVKLGTEFLPILKETIQAFKAAKADQEINLEEVQQLIEKFHK
jgi:Cu/Ag efflux pump CusA